MHMYIQNEIQVPVIKILYIRTGVVLLYKNIPRVDILRECGFLLIV